MLRRAANLCGRRHSRQGCRRLQAGVLDKATPAALAALGGRYVVPTQAIKSLDGPSPQRFALLAFDSVEAALFPWWSFPVREFSLRRAKLKLLRC